MRPPPSNSAGLPMLSEMHSRLQQGIGSLYVHDQMIADAKARLGQQGPHRLTLIRLAESTWTCDYNVMSACVFRESLTQIFQLKKRDGSILSACGDRAL